MLEVIDILVPRAAFKLHLLVFPRLVLINLVADVGSPEHKAEASRLGILLLALHKHNILVPRHVGDNCAACEWGDNVRILIGIRVGEGGGDVLEQLHVGQRVVSSVDADIARLEVHAGADFAEPVEQAHFQFQQAVCPCGVGGAALQQGADSGLQQLDVAFPETEVQPQSDRSGQHGIHSPHGVEVVLADLGVARATAVAHIQQGHVETERGHDFHIEQEGVLHLGLEGGSHDKAAAILDGNHVGVAHLAGVGHLVLVHALDILPLVLLSEEELLNLVVQRRQGVGEGVAGHQVHGEGSLAGEYVQKVAAHFKAHTFVRIGLADAEIPVGGVLLLAGAVLDRVLLVVHHLQVDGHIKRHLHVKEVVVLAVGALFG